MGHTQIHRVGGYESRWRESRLRWILSHSTTTPRKKVRRRELQIQLRRCYLTMQPAVGMTLLLGSFSRQQGKSAFFRYLKDQQIRIWQSVNARTTGGKLLSVCVCVGHNDMGDLHSFHIQNN